MQTASTDSWQVICLCAAWCGVCRDWRPMLRDLAGAHPEWHVAWVDIEDQDEAMGDVDVETFPTLLVAEGGEPRFFGPVPPSAPQLERLVQRLQARAEPTVPAGVAALLRRLQPVLGASAL